MIERSAIRLETDRERDIYYAGQIDGLSRYAWWEGGVQYVGNCGDTLKEALREIERERYEPCATAGDDSPARCLAALTAENRRLHNRLMRDFFLCERCGGSGLCESATCTLCEGDGYLGVKGDLYRFVKSKVANDNTTLTAALQASTELLRDCYGELTDWREWHRIDNQIAANKAALGGK